MCESKCLKHEYESFELEDVIFNSIEYKIKQETFEEIWFDVVQILNIKVGLNYNSENDSFAPVIQLFGNNEAHKFLLSLSCSQWQEVLYYLTHESRTVAKKNFGDFKICYDVYIGEIKYVFIYGDKKLFCTTGTINNLIKISSVIECRLQNLLRLNFNECFQEIISSVKDIIYLYNESTFQFERFVKLFEILNSRNNNMEIRYAMTECSHFCLSKLKKEYNQMLLYSYKCTK